MYKSLFFYLLSASLGVPQGGPRLETGRQSSKQRMVWSCSRSRFRCSRFQRFPVARTLGVPAECTFVCYSLDSPMKVYIAADKKHTDRHENSTSSIGHVNITSYYQNAVFTRFGTIQKMFLLQNHFLFLYPYSYMRSI